MKAAAVRRYGGPDVVTIHVVSDPEPGEHDVQVRVGASLVTSSDAVSRSGTPRFARLYFGLRRPKNPVLGCDFAGVVAATGASVTRFAVGQRVFGTIAPRFGAHAEFVCLPEHAALAITPAELGDDQAVAVVDGSLTALPFLRDSAHLVAGERILVNGGSSAVGLAAIQLARHFGAHVTAVTSTGNLACVTEAGADAVIDYTITDFTAGARQFDVVFDAVGKSSWSRCRGGRYLTTVPSLGILVAQLLTRLGGSTRATISFTGLRSTADKAGDLALIRELAVAGVLHPVIDSTYPLSEAGAAHARVDTGRKRGNVVLLIEQSSASAPAT